MSARGPSPAPSRAVSPVRVTTFMLVLLSAPIRAAPYELQFCSFFGGNRWERIQAVSADASGNIYVVGSTKSTNFPTTGGAYDETGARNNSNDGFVAKVAPDGARVLWCTHLHGSDRDDIYGVHVDSSGFVYAVGWTRSPDFPTTPGAYDRTHNGDMDVFLTKITPDGSALVFSTFFGGSRIDQCRGGMDFDAAGNIYLSGYTDSTDFPATSGAIQSSFRGGYGDAFVAKLSGDGSGLLYATYLGSTGPDHAFPGVRVHTDGSIVVTGVAGAADFPTTAGAYQRAFAGTPISGVWYGDAFVARFSLTPTHETTLHFSTFLGGSGKEVSTAQHGIAVDNRGNTVVAITTHSTDFPTTPGAFQSALNGATSNVCLVKLPPDGASLLASTYLGGSPQNGYEPNGLALAPDGNVLVTGSIFGGITDHPVTPDAYRGTSAGEGETFFAVLSPDLSALRYSSYFGGSGNDRIRDLARSGTGDLIFAGDTYSTDLPVTARAFQRTYAGSGDAYIVRFRAPSKTSFLRGDANAQDGLDLADAVFILTYLFADGLAATCFDAADANDDGRLDLSDGVAILSHLFGDWGALPEPFAACGEDPTSDVLECGEYTPCTE